MQATFCLEITAKAMIDLNQLLTIKESHLNRFESNYDIVFVMTGVIFYQYINDLKHINWKIKRKKF